MMRARRLAGAVPQLSGLIGLIGRRLLELETARSVPGRFAEGLQGLRELELETPTT